jgi:hypothetical protein
MVQTKRIDSIGLLASNLVIFYRINQFHQIPGKVFSVSYLLLNYDNNVSERQQETH